jgi:hypothetical protein
VRFVLAVAASLTLAAPAGATSPATRTSVYRPFVRGKLSSRLHVTTTLKGHCWTGSSADPRSDAWRCLSGNFIYDPCFSDPQVPSWVACPADGSPFGTGVLRLSLSRALPRSFANHGAPGEGYPWALKLAGGQVCTFLTGATFEYHGKRANYGCTAKIFLAGSPVRSGPTWTITLGTGRKSRPRTAEILVAAW